MGQQGTRRYPVSEMVCGTEVFYRYPSDLRLLWEERRTPQSTKCPPSSSVLTKPRTRTPRLKSSHALSKTSPRHGAPRVVEVVERYGKRRLRRVARQTQQPTMIYAWLVGILAAIAGAFTALSRVYKWGPFLENEDMTNTDNEVVPVMAPTSPKTAPTALLWGNKAQCYHSVRLIADDMKLNLEDKNLLCAVIMGESEFNTHSKNINYARHPDGTKYVSSTDFGICQWNDYWHGKEISPHDAEFNPEKAVRLMVTYLKQGQIKQWCAYSNSSYKKWLNPLSPMWLLGKI